MLHTLKKILLHKNTGKAIFGIGIAYTLANAFYQEATREETWRRMIKEEIALLNEKKEN